MLQILALHYCSYFRTEYTHPPFHSLDAEPLLFTNATERECAGDNKKKVIYYPEIVRCRKRVGLRASY